jgi:hypothetical protein
MEGIDLGIGCFEKLQSLVSSSESDPYRSKVAEEMLLCEVIIAHISESTMEAIFMRVPLQQREASISLRGSCRQTVSIFKRICLGISALWQTWYG